MTVAELVGKMERGELRLPEMQRNYVWRAPRVRDLLDSLYRGYPSGAILAWETDDANVALRDAAFSPSSGGLTSPPLLLLDGQQRLTSLSAVLLGKPVRVRGRGTMREIEILFNLDHPDDVQLIQEVDENSDGDEETGDEIEDDLIANADRLTFVVGVSRLKNRRNWVSVTEVFKSSSDASFLKHAGVTGFDDPNYERYSARLARLRDIKNYSYRMDVLERTKTYEEVTEIFVRVNSLGAKLRSSDLALAQVTAKWRGSLAIFQKFEKDCINNRFDLEIGVHLKNLVAFATQQSKFLSVGRIPLDTLKTSWESAQAGMNFAINFARHNCGITSAALLSSPFLMIVLAIYGHHRGYSLGLDDAADLRQWALLANAKGRFSRGSTETFLDQDLQVILKEQGTPRDLIDRLRLQVGKLDFTPEDLQGRNQRSAVFKTMFIAFRAAGAKDWKSQLAISEDLAGSSSKLQFHHIFPKARLAAVPRSQREIDDVANLAFVGGSTNLGLGAKLPEEYIPFILKNKESADLVEQGDQTLFGAQCIPLSRKLLALEAYPEFLRARRELIATRLNEFLGVGPSEFGARTVRP